MAHVYGESVGCVTTYGTMRNQRYRRLDETSVTVRHPLNLVRGVNIGARNENDMRTLHGIYMLNKTATKFISNKALFLQPMDADLHHAIANDDTVRMGTAWPTHA